MTLTVNLINSFINLLFFLILSSSTIGKASIGASIDALKPCFERYIGQRLSNLSPYHSEWRMRTPEECLVFCALSSSRCRSTVYDIFQHICYYFLDDGQQHKQIARGMVYFRVTEKKCLDQSLNNSNPALANSEFAIPITSAPSSTPEYDIRRNFNELQQPAVVYANSLIHIPPGGRAITPTPYFAYFGNQQKLRKSEKFDESNLTVLTSTTIKSDNITISTNNTITVTSPTTSPISSSTFSTTIAEKEDEIYDDPIQILPDSEFSSSTFPMLSSWPRKDSIRSTVRRSEALKQPNHQIHKISNDASFFVGNIANLPQFNKNFGNDRQKNGADLNKPLKTIPQDIRRSPFKTSLMDIEKLDKDRNEMLTSINTENSIMDKMMPIPTIKSISMTLSKQNNEMKKFSSSVILQTAICESNELEVWLVVENAVLQIDKLQMKMSAGSHKSCRTKCNLITKSGRECSSYIYDDVKRHCVIHTNYDVAVISLDLLPSPETDFTIRTAIKFCFPESLTIFEECFEFVAFLDRAMDIEPREILDNIPRDYHGLHECIELCVLASYFHCKSAKFVINLGKCFLYDENSASRPEYFHKHQQYGLIYFENKCEQFDEKQSPAKAQLEHVPIKLSNDVWR